MRMKWLDILVLLYGIALIAGGIDGFLHHSVISLIAGGTAGVLEIGFVALTATNPRVGRIGSAVVALLILGKFAPDAFNKQTAFAIFMAAFSLAVFLCLGAGHMIAMKNRKSGLLD